MQIGPRIRIGGTIGKIGQNVKNAVVKGVKDTGHEIGRAASNPWVQAALATGLAATGVGAPAAAGIMAATRGGGALLKPGGNIGDGLLEGAKGAAIGYGAAKAGDLVRGGLGALRGAGTASGGISGNLPTMADLPGVQYASPSMSNLLAPLAGGSGSTAGTAAVFTPGSSLSVGGIGKGVGSLMNGMKSNALPLAMIGQGFLSARAQGRAADIEDRRLSMDEERAAWERQQYEEEMARRRQMAELLRPLYEQMMNNRVTMAPNPYVG